VTLLHKIFLRLLPLALAAIGSSLSAADEPGKEPFDLGVTIARQEPIGVLAGSEITLKFEVFNLGANASPASRLNILISEDKLFTEEDSAIGALYVPELESRSGQGLMWRGELIHEAGTYWLAGCVLTDGPDTSPENNCSDPLAVSMPSFDLLATQVDVKPDRVVSGVRVLMRAATSNQGSDPSLPTRIRYVLSPDMTITPSDPNVLSVDMPSLGPGERWAETVQAELVGFPGDYWLGACIESPQGEGDRRNNCTAGRAVSIVEDSFADLIIEAVRVRPQAWSENSEVDFYAEVVNAGESRSAATTVSFYLSESSDEPEDGVLLGTMDVEPVDPERMQGVDLFLDPGVAPGVYWLSACVEPTDEELDTYNNCAVGPQVEVTPFDFSD
jgi:hypothetical protein